MKIITLIASFAAASFVFAQSQPSSIEALAYSSATGESGLRLAWRSDSTQPWQPLDHTLLKSDFGAWGSHKKMWAPDLSFDPTTKLWTATWIADLNGYVKAQAVSKDLKTWQPQTYSMSQEPREKASVQYVAGKIVMGTIFSMPSEKIIDLENYAAERHAKWLLSAEQMKDDSTRFAQIDMPHYNIKALPKQKKNISDMLMGIFFEDINYAADGGLYAELIENRDFEYDPSDRNEDANWHSLASWSFPLPDKGCYKISTENPLHPNNPHYLSIVSNQPGFKVTNDGYDGIAICDGTYDFSMHACGNAHLQIAIANQEGDILAKKEIAIDSSKWQEYTAELTTDLKAENAHLEITFLTSGQADLDLISLFPRDTFKGRKNGMRRDLSEALEALKPQFMRFPGGCLSHGDGWDNHYDWKGSIGNLEERKPKRNIWNYHQTRGLGFYEFFQFCEDIGAEPLPVLPAGVPCQNSSHASHFSHDAITTYGQQGGLPLEEMPAYIQDLKDLIEYANGPVDSEWGSKRAASGHPEPFGLKYLGIGNEDMITPIFEERYKMITNALRESNPEITIVGTVGPFFEGSDYTRGWEFAREQKIDMVDEHYYVSPGWLIYNQDFYEDYPREGTKVYLGEWASHVPGRASNMETALSEAIYLTSVERNADVVRMSSYAPLLAREGHTQWRPDLIYFNNSNIHLTPDYYVMQLYGQNAGNAYIPATTSLSVNDKKAEVRVGSSIVYDNKSGEYIVKLVNLLPTEVSTTIDVSELKIKNKQPIAAFLLTGRPNDENVEPVTPSIAPLKSGKLHHSLPPYSFTVIRYK